MISDQALADDIDMMADPAYAASVLDDLVAAEKLLGKMVLAWQRVAVSLDAPGVHAFSKLITKADGIVSSRREENGR